MYRRKIINLAGLVSGYVVGQGGMFAAQTWLIAHGRVAFLAEFSSVFLFATLISIVVDWGGLIIFAREGALADTGLAFRRLFWSLSLWRLVIASICLGASIAAMVWIGSYPFIKWYAVGASVGMFAVALGPSGLIDGMSLSGWSGIASAMTFMASAATLPLASDMDGARAGMVLGFTYSAGSVASVVLQHFVVWRCGRILNPTRPNLDVLVRAIQEGAAFLALWMPGQFFFRGQLAISAAVLGPVTTGSFAYAKQISIAAAQMLTFVRRTEFPALVIAVQRAPSKVFEATARTQGVSLILAAISIPAAVLAGFMIHRWLGGSFAEAGTALILFAPAIAINAVALSLTQTCAAIRRLGMTAWLSLLCFFVIGLPVSYLGAKLAGVPGLIAAEIGVNVVMVAALAVFLFQARSRHSDA